MARSVADFQAVRTMGLALPDVTEGSAYGSPALKVRGKMFACVPVNKSAEAGSLAVRINFERRARLLEEFPAVYYVTDHYEPHPIVLVRLARISRTELRRLLRQARDFMAMEPGAARPPRSSPRAKR